MVHNNVMRYKVRDVFDDVTKYGTKIKTSQYLEHGKYPIFDQGKDYIAGYTNEDEGIFQKVPVILFGDHTGILKYITRPCFLGADGVKLLKPKDSNIVVKYLFYALNNVNIPDAGYSRHFKWLKEGEIPIPPKEQQSMIVEILDELSYIVQKEKEMLIKFDELVKSRFLELFGDPNDVSILSLPGEKKSIEDVCDGIYGGGTPSKSHKEYYTGKIPWVTPKDMKTLSIDDSQNHINSEAIENSTAKLIPKRCVLMVIRSGILKHTLPVAINNVEVTINQDMKAFVPSSLITPEYLLYTFKLMEKSILSKVRGVTADNIEFSEFRKRRIVVPPIEVQTQFVDFALSIDKSKMAVQKSLDELETLKKSLMQTYFG